MIATLRDLSIILLAITSLVVGVVLIILLWQIRNLVVLLRQEIKPLIASTQQTADTVRTTSQFMAKRVAKPFVNVASLAAGVRQGVVTLRENILPPRNGPPSPQSPTTAAPAPPPAQPDPEVSYE